MHHFIEGASFPQMKAIYDRSPPVLFETRANRPNDVRQLKAIQHMDLGTQSEGQLDRNLKRGLSFRGEIGGYQNGADLLNCTLLNPDRAVGARQHCTWRHSHDL